MIICTSFCVSLAVSWLLLLSHVSFGVLQMLFHGCMVIDENLKEFHEQVQSSYYLNLYPEKVLFVDLALFIDNTSPDLEDSILNHAHSILNVLLLKEFLSELNCLFF